MANIKTKPTWMFLAAFFVVIILPLKFKQNEKNANLSTGNVANINHSRTNNPDSLQHVAVTEK